MDFHHFHQNITKTMGFILVLNTLYATTKENQWFFNIVSKLLQKTTDCIAKTA